MRPPAISGAPSLIVDAGSGAKLRAGVPISVTILESPAPGLYRILAEGQTLSARSGLALSPGSVLLARVLPASAGSGIILRLEPGPTAAALFPPGIDALLVRLGLPVDAAGRLAASALLAEGLAPGQASLNRVKRSILGLAGLDGGDKATSGEAARLAARLEAKGLASGPEAVAALAAAGDGRSGGGSGGGSSGGQGKQGRGSQDGQGRPQPAQGQADPGPAQAGPDTVADGEGRAAPSGSGAPEVRSGLVVASLPAEGEALAKELGAFLRRLAFSAPVTDPPASEPSRPEAGGASGPIDGPALLSLFNHARPEGQGWIILPFRFALDSVAFAGSFRILLPYMPGGPGRIEASFDASAGGFEGLEAKGEAREARAWGFELSFGAGRPRLVIHGGEGLPGLSGMVAALAAELGEAGCETRLARTEGPVTGGRADIDAWA